jgi:hypothetical protein
VFGVILVPATNNAVRCFAVWAAQSSRRCSPDVSTLRKGEKILLFTSPLWTPTCSPA